MNSEVKIYEYPGGEIQHNDAALGCFYDIYRNYLVPGCPEIFGGAAQILIRNQRFLRISDRNVADNSDAERRVPLELIVR